MSDNKTLSPEFTKQLTDKFGPIANVLVKFAAKKQANSVDDPDLKTFFLLFLQEHESDILSWVNEGDGAIFDMLINIVGRTNPLLAKVLIKFKDKLVPAGNTLSKQVLDQFIVDLQKV